MVWIVELMFEMVDCGKLIFLSRISVLTLLGFSVIDEFLDDLLNARNVELFFSLMIRNFLFQSGNDALIFLYFILHLWPLRLLSYYCRLTTF